MKPNYYVIPTACQSACCQHIRSNMKIEDLRTSCDCVKTESQCAVYHLVGVLLGLYKLGGQDHQVGIDLIKWTRQTDLEMFI